MSGREPLQFPLWRFSSGELEALLEDEGWDGVEELERVCRFRPGRIDELAERGWDPLFWEFRRMSVAMDFPMDDLADIICPIWVPRERS